MTKDGHENIEQPDGNLKKWHSFAFGRYAETIDLPSREEYYRLAGQFLYEYEFESKLDRLMWEAHSLGECVRDISKKLKAFKHTKKSTIHNRLTELAKEMLEQCRKR